MGDRRATGTFEVTMEPQGAPDTAAGTSLGDGVHAYRLDYTLPASTEPGDLAR